MNGWIRVFKLLVLTSLERWNAVEHAFWNYPLNGIIKNINLGVEFEHRFFNRGNPP